MTNQKYKSVAMLVAMWLAGTGLAEAQSTQAKLKSKKGQEEPTRFLNMKRDASGSPLSLQTAITRFRSENDEVLVDLVGAVHIGEKPYYKQINKQLSQYDVVLYELVAPKGTRVPAGGKRESASMNPISWLQDSSKRMLGLSSQLEYIDYQAGNFVHADLSPAEMQEKMAERGDNMLTVGLSAISEMIRQQNLQYQKMKSGANSTSPASLADMMDLMNNPLEMKRMMASQFTANDSMDLGLGQTLNQLIVTDRNEAAIKEMQKQLAKGKKKIAIFYGAAHMPDFEKRLLKDFDLRKTHHVWVDAWDLTRAPKQQKTNDLGSMLMQLIESLDD